MIERFERREHAANGKAVVEYLRALVATNVISEYLPDERTGRTSGLPALVSTSLDIQNCPLAAFAGKKLHTSIECSRPQLFPKFVMFCTVLSASVTMQIPICACPFVSIWVVKAVARECLL